MMWDKQNVLDVFRMHLPPEAEILVEEDSDHKPYIRMADLDGDGLPEIAGAYRWEGDIYILLLKNDAFGYRVASNFKGKSNHITYFNAVRVTGRTTNNLLIGWHMGARSSQLSVYEWTREGLKDIVPRSLSYSYIDVADMPGSMGRDGKVELALWSYDSREAYKAEVLRWSGGNFVPAYDVYPHYYQKVAAYYQKKTNDGRNDPLYWYYLADAQMKADRPDEALASIKAAMSQKPVYPAKKEWIKLIQKIRYQLALRTNLFYPASVKTRDGVKWGYIDDKGHFVIPPQFDYAEDFQENGLAVVQVKNRSGVISRNGQYVVAPRYNSITKFTEGRAAVIDDQGFKLIDENGAILTRKPYSFISMFQEGRALFSTTNEQGKYLYGYLDRQGKEVIPPQFEAAHDFKEGKAVVQIKEGEYALINPAGERLQTYRFPFVGPLGDGLLAFAQNSSGPYGYIDEKGNVVISPKFTSAQAFDSGRAVVNTTQDFPTNQYGLIDKTGKFIIKPEYNDIELLGEDRVAVGRAKDSKQPFLGSTYAIADVNGRFLTDFLYQQVTNYKNGLASAADRQYTFFIDKSGKIVKSLPILRGSGTLSMEGNLIKAFVDQRVSYYDRSGKLVWQQNTVIPLTDQYRVVEIKYNPNRDYLVYYPQIEGMTNRGTQDRVNQRLKELSQVKPIDSNVQLDYSYSGDFSVEFFKKQLLVLELTGYNYPFGAAHGMPSKIYVNIDLKNGRIFELKDLFKPNSDYVKVLSDLIGNQIKNNPEYSYVFPDSYKGIEANQPFYVREDALYIYFFPYDIAPYAAGFPTFRIPFAEIMNIIDVNGEFWRSFH